MNSRFITTLILLVLFPSHINTLNASLPYKVDSHTTSSNSRLSVDLHICTLDTIHVQYVAKLVTPRTHYDACIQRAGQEFVDSTLRVELELGFPVGTLLAIMYSESHLNPQSKNPNSTATGLIGFMQNTRRILKMTNASGMTALEQLYYVKQFYMLDPKALETLQQLYTPEDVYLYTFYPRAIGRGDSFEFGSERGKKYARKLYNKTYDMMHDANGVYTVSDFKHYLRTSPRYAGTVFSKSLLNR